VLMARFLRIYLLEQCEEMLRLPSHRRVFFQPPDARSLSCSAANSQVRA
jgi:hypothetical protein